jgi:hypothetical protein
VKLYEAILAWLIVMSLAVGACQTPQRHVKIEARNSIELMNKALNDRHAFLDEH